MSDTENTDVNTDPELIELLESIEDDSVQKMLHHARGEIPESELSVSEWVEPLKVNEKIWLLLYNTNTLLMMWMHYDNEDSDFLVHPINDWDAYHAKMDEFEEEVTDPDSPFTIEPQHRENTPFSRD